MCRVRSITVAVLSACALAGCRPTAGVKIADLDPLGWGVTDTACIEFINTDTLTPRCINLLLRVDRNFKPNDIPLTIRVMTPDSLWYEERFTARPAPIEPSGKDYRETTIPYRDNVMLSALGKYIFRVSPTEGTVRGAWGIGITTQTNSNQHNGQE